MEIRLIDEKFIGVFLKEYNPRYVNLIKTLPGARFEPKARFWYFPLDGLARSTIETLAARCNATIEPRVLSHIEQFAQPVEANFESNLPLYPYQREICQFMVKSGSALNASFVGSGKTLTSLATCEALSANRVLIIVPKSVLLQWAQIEIPKWLPEATVTAIQGATRDRHDQYIMFASGYMIVGYETARVDIEYLATFDWDVIITDEAHRLANPGTKLYKALMKLKAKHRFALTATPVMNKPDDLFGVINWIRPGALGNYYQFLNRYIVKGGFQSKQVVGNKNMAELAERCKLYIMRKTLDEVDLQLPAYTEQELPVELSAHERKNYDLIVKELLFDIDKAIISKIDNPVMLQMSIVKLNKLMELCDSMELIGEDNTSSKIDSIKDLLDNILV